MKAGKEIIGYTDFSRSMPFPSSAGGGEKEHCRSGSCKNEEKMLIPGGTAVGVTLESNGILVLGTRQCYGQRQACVFTG